MTARNKTGRLRRLTTCCACSLVLLLIAAERNAADQLAQGARRTVTIHWDQVPLRDAVERLGELFEDAVFVDRRVDPEQRVTLDVEASDADEVLATIAESRNLGVGRLGPLLYLGPRTAAERLAPLARAKDKELARLNIDRQASMGRRMSISWSRLAEPRVLVQSLLEERGVRVIGLKRVPHDLWAAGKLPALTLAQQLTILLIGFDLTFEVRPSKRTIEIVPLDAAQLANLQPATERPRQLSPPRTVRSPGQAKQVYTLRVAEQPVEVVLRELARRLGWRVEIDEAGIKAAGATLERRVSFDVENVGQDELLEALLEPAGFAFVREGEKIKIVPRTPDD
jgi:hypothetical protein